MRLKQFLRSIHSLATAEALYSPIAGTFERDAPFGHVEKSFDPFEERIAVVSSAGRPIGVIDSSAFCHAFFAEESKREEGTGRRAGDISKPYRLESVVPLEATYLQILEAAQKAEPDFLLVGDDHEIVGSLSVEDLLKPPGLVYLLCLSLDLESAAVELCSLYPRSFDNLDKKRQALARNVYKKKQHGRLNALIGHLSDCGLRPHSDLIRRELIQATTMSDKKMMLIRSDFGLDQTQIETVFLFCERIRNYIVHPRASFTHSGSEADMLEYADHEALCDEGLLNAPFSRSITQELSIDRLQNLAHGVLECRKLTAEIDRVRARL